MDDVLSALITSVMKLLCGLFAAAFAVCCFLTQAGTGAAPQDIHRRTVAASRGGTTAFDHLTIVAKQGNSDAPYEVGRNNAGAVRSIREGAEQGDARAQARLGTIYKDGEGAARDDAVAVAWYEKAADQGLAQAQYDLGLMYATGRGVEQDFAKAAAWYRKAAEQRLAVAQFSLGYMYLKGRGVEQDLELAAKWYRKAADQGDGGAQLSLALSYENGRGVQQDFVQSIEWLILASANGVPEAEQKLKRLEHRATRSQIAEAKALAGRWRRHATRG